MKETKRILAAGLSAALLVSSLAACSSTTQSEGSGEAESNSGTAMEGAAYTLAGYTYEGDVCEEIFGLPADTVIATVGDGELTLGEIGYWLTYDANILAYYSYGSLDTIAWDDSYSDDQTMGEYVKEDALTIAINYKVIEQKAAELGLELTEEQTASVDETLQNYIDTFGETLWDNAVSAGTINEDDFDDEAKAAWIQAAGEADMVNETAIYVTTQDYLRYMNEIYQYYAALQDHYFGEDGELAPTEEDLAQYVEDEGYVASQSILFMNLEDADGNTVAFSDMDDDQKAELKAKAQAALDDILAAEDPDAKFEEYQAESDDTGSNTAGASYTFQDGDMVSEYYEGVTALSEGELGATLVESADYGYFIVKRLTVDTASVPVSDSGYGYSIETLYINSAFNTLMDSWVQDANAEATDDYNNLDLTSYCTNLVALSNALYPSTEETADETDSAETNSAETESAESESAETTSAAE